MRFLILIFILCFSNIVAFAKSIDDFANNYIVLAKAFYPIIENIFYENNNEYLNPLDKKNIFNAESFLEKQLLKLKEFDVKDLNEKDLITYKIPEFQIISNLDFLKERIPYYLVFQPMFGKHIEFVSFVSSDFGHIFKTVYDYDNWYKKMITFSEFLNDSIEVLKNGIKDSIVLQKSLVLHIVEQFKYIGSTTLNKNPLFVPVVKLEKNNNISENDKKRIKNKYKKILEEKLLPAYKKVEDFLIKEYLLKASYDTGVGQFVGGRDFYSLMIRKFAESELSADFIHELGKRDVRKITSEIKKYQTDKKPYYFKTEKEVFDYINGISKTVNSNVYKLFEKIPKAKLLIKKADPYIFGLFPRYIKGNSNTENFGIYYVPINNLKKNEHEASFLYNAIPGNHYQISLIAENQKLNMFRKNIIFSSMFEGWAFYTASLGKELGLYENEFEYLNYLEMSLRKAIGLVIDTGIHTKGWSKEDAIKYSQKYLQEPREETIRVVERYMALPGQALSYKIGYLKIIEILEKYKKELNDGFDIKDFHNTLLKNGSVPLHILGEIMNNELEKQKLLLFEYETQF